MVVPLKGNRNEKLDRCKVSLSCRCDLCETQLHLNLRPDYVRNSHSYFSTKALEMSY